MPIVHGGIRGSWFGLVKKGGIFINLYLQISIIIFVCVLISIIIYSKKKLQTSQKNKKKCNYNKWWLWTRVSAISENYMSKVCVILISITIILFIKCFKSFFDLSFESKNNVRNTNYFTKYFINCWYGEWLLINEKKWY